MASKAILRCKEQTRELTRRTRGVSIERMAAELAQYLAAQSAGSAHGRRHAVNCLALTIALPNACFDSLGIPRLTGGRQLDSPNRRIRTCRYGGVTGKAGGRPPVSIQRAWQ